MNTPDRSDRVAALVLAAGASSRMGSPKPLLRWHGTSLIRHVTNAALTSTCQEVIVVLGEQAERLEPELAGLAVRSVLADDWREGLSASLHAGIRAVPDDCGAALILLCDQPAVTPELLSELIAVRSASGRPIAACAYDATLGPPALFGREFFPELLRLEGDQGAKALLMRDPSSVARLPFPEGAHDLDTPADLERGRRR